MGIALHIFLTKSAATEARPETRDGRNSYHFIFVVQKIHLPVQFRNFDGCDVPRSVSCVSLHMQTTERVEEFECILKKTPYDRRWTGNRQNTWTDDTRLTHRRRARARARENIIIEVILDRILMPATSTARSNTHTLLVRS